MAEHAGIMAPDEFDLVGFAVGVVERDEILGPAPGRGRRRPARPALARACAPTATRWPATSCSSGPACAYDDPAWPGAATTVADELLRPSVIYTPAVRAAMAAADVHAVAHITGGGFEGNIPRALPEGCRAVLVRGTWEIPPIFTEIRRLGMVDDDEMARVFNLGLGMVVAVSAGHGRRRPSTPWPAPGSTPWWSAGSRRASAGSS